MVRRSTATSPRPTIARTPAAHTRHTGLTAELLSLARAAQSSAAAGFSSSSAAGALGSLLITWCVVLLEVAPADTVAEAAANLATAGEALEGLSWARELLRTPGFRHDDPAEEISSIARLLLFDLAGGMLDQPRYRSSSGGGGGGGPATADASDPEPADESSAVGTTAMVESAASAADVDDAPICSGWPAHSEQLILLTSALLEAAQALPDVLVERVTGFLQAGSLSSMLLHARYPLRVEPLASLLSALCADADSASRAWARPLADAGLPPSAKGSARVARCGALCYHGRRQQRRIAAAAAAGAAPRCRCAVRHAAPRATRRLGRRDRLELAYEENESGVVIEWQLPAEQSLDIGPRLGEAVEALLRAGARASPELVRSAECALALLAHAPSAHTPSELLDLLPPLSSLVELLPLCAQLSGQLPADIERPISLLSLQLLASIAPHMPQQLAVALDRAWQLWSDSSWLPKPDYARHASALLQTLHALASASMAPSAAPGERTPPLAAAYRFVATQLLPARGGGETGWQLELKLRAVSLLIEVIDAGGELATELIACLLDSRSVHSALLEVLRWSSGGLQAELSRCRLSSSTAALDASEPPCAPAMLLVLSGTLGLLCRLLQAAHSSGGAGTPPCMLHGALLAHAPGFDPSPAEGLASGVECLGLCIVLHTELADTALADAPSPHAATTWRCSKSMRRRSASTASAPPTAPPPTPPLPGWRPACCRSPPLASTASVHSPRAASP